MGGLFEGLSRENYKVTPRSCWTSNTAKPTPNADKGTLQKLGGYGVHKKEVEGDRDDVRKSCI